jgi:hypothetical protein
VPFTLSAKPTRQWRRILEAELNGKLGEAQATVKGAGLLLVCTAAKIATTFDKLKAAVASTNLKYGAVAQEASAKAGANEPKVEASVAKDQTCAAEINPILNELDYH